MAARVSTARHGARSALSAVPSRTIPHSTTIFLPTPSSHKKPQSLTISNLLLRDSSRHATHLHPASQQKLFKSTQIPWRCHVTEAQLVRMGIQNNGKVEEECVQLTWDAPLLVPKETTMERHISIHPLSWFQRHIQLAPSAPPLPASTPWSASTLPATLSRIHHSSYSSSTRHLHSHLTSLLRNGIAFIDAVGIGTKRPVLRTVVERIGKIRETWYGTLWDVRAEEGSKNIAYTDLELGLHMDLTHFVSPPRYQYLHSLLNRQIIGGTSYFVDTYHIISILKLYHPQMYQTLCNEDVEFSYENGGKWTRFRRRTIEVERDENGEDQVLAVNYSPPFQGELTLSKRDHPTSPSKAKNYAPETASPKAPVSSTIAHSGAQSSLILSDAGHNASDSTLGTISYIDRLEALYRALKKFDELCEQPENQWSYLLKEGDCVVFDNRRILHGRKSFRFMNEEEVIASELPRLKPELKDNGDGVIVAHGVITAEEGASPVAIRPTNRRRNPLHQDIPNENELNRGRWLKGAYLDADELHSKWRIGEAARIKRAAAQRVDFLQRNRQRRVEAATSGGIVSEGQNTMLAEWENVSAEMEQL